MVHRLLLWSAVPLSYDSGEGGMAPPVKLVI
jgi:hypothetical protein